jgi:molybdenum cofactor cytidylyltransferase
MRTGRGCVAEAAPVAILVPAAGAARRMRGGDKLLEEVDGRPLIARQAGIAAATGCPVLVTLPPDRPARAAALAGLPVETVIVPDAAEGMAASIRAGARWAGGRARALMILLPDLPGLGAEDLRALIAAQSAEPRAIWQATAADGTPGHPVIWPDAVFPALAGLAGDGGARAILAAPPVPLRRHPLPGDRATADLDTPEAWAEWRARQPDAIG